MYAGTEKNSAFCSSRYSIKEETDFLVAWLPFDECYIAIAHNLPHNGLAHYYPSHIYPSHMYA